MVLAKLIESSCSEFQASSFMFTLLQRLWRFVNGTMFGLDRLTLVVSMMGTLSAGAGCPDYSTYSQVRLHTKTRLTQYLIPSRRRVATLLPVLWAYPTCDLTLRAVHLTAHLSR